METILWKTKENENGVTNAQENICEFVNGEILRRSVLLQLVCHEIAI